MADDIVLKVVIQASEAAKTVGELKSSQRDLIALLERTEVGTKRFNDLTTALGKTKGQMLDLKQQIIALNPERQFAAITKIGSTIASGFAAAQGAAALFGSQSEDLTRVLVKVQAATALAQGLQGLSGFVKALQTARLAMIAFAATNPFAAIAAVVIALGAAIAALALDVEEESKAMKEAKPIIDDYAKAHDEARESIENVHAELLKEKGIISQNAVDTIKILNEKNQKLRDADDEYLKLTKEKTDAFNNGEYRDRNEFDSDLLDLKTAWLQKTQDITDLYAEKDRLSKEKSANDLKSKEDAAARKSLEDAEKNRVEKLRNESKFDEEHLKQHQAFVDAIASIEKEAYDKERAEQQMQDDWVISQIEKTNELKIERDRAYLAAKQEVQNAELAITEIGLRLAQQASGKNRALADTLFAIEKAVSIARIIVSTQAEISGYFLSAASPAVAAFGPAAVAAAQATAVAQSLGAKARAAVGIATILATTISKFMSGGGSSGGSTPSPGGGSASAPSIQSPQGQTFAVNNATQTQTNDKGDFESFRTQERQMSVRAYVVETDITQSQKTVRNIEERAKY